MNTKTFDNYGNHTPDEDVLSGLCLNMPPSTSRHIKLNNKNTNRETNLKIDTLSYGECLKSKFGFQ